MKMNTLFFTLTLTLICLPSLSFGAANPHETRMSKTGRHGEPIWWLSVPELGGDEVAFARVNGNVTYVHPDYSGTSLPRGLYYWKGTHDVRAVNPTTSQIGATVWHFDPNVGAYVNGRNQIFDPSKIKWVDPSRSVAFWREAENRTASGTFAPQKPLKPQKPQTPQQQAQGSIKQQPQIPVRAVDLRPAPGAAIDRDRIVEAALGVPESQFVQDLNAVQGGGAHTQATLRRALIAKNPHYACIFEGSWSQPTLARLRQAYAAQPAQGNGTLTILKHDDRNPRYTDIRYLQETHPDWFFMIASNFDGLEGGMSNPMQTLEGPRGMNSAPVQGEEAQMATICAAVSKKYILQPINFLESQNLFSIIQQPGSPPLIGLVKPPIIAEIISNHLAHIPMHYLDNISIGLNQNIIVTSGYFDDRMIARSRGAGMKPQFNKMLATSGPAAQKVNHIYFASHDLDPNRFAKRFNRQPGRIDRMVAQAVARAGYEAAILAAIVNNAPGLILPMMGCGSFKNEAQWIVDIIDELAPLIAASGIEIKLVVRLKDSAEENHVAQQLMLIKRNNGI